MFKIRNMRIRTKIKEICKISIYATKMFVFEVYLLITMDQICIESE